MLLGKPLRAAISRSGSASPDARKAESTRDECTTDLTRYGSRAGAMDVSSRVPVCETPWIVAQERVRELRTRSQNPFPITRFPIAATRRLEVRAELFNVFNNTNFGAPATNISNPTAGIITAADDARHMLLAVRMIW